MTTKSSFFANNVDAIASAGFRSPSGILRLLATATIEPSYDHLIILSVRFRHSFCAPILGMVKETAVVEKPRGVRRDPGGTGMLKARLGVHLFACWPRRDNLLRRIFTPYGLCQQALPRSALGRRRLARHRRAHGDGAVEAVHLLDPSCIAAFATSRAARV